MTHLHAKTRCEAPLHRCAYLAIATSLFQKKKKEKESTTSIINQDKRHLLRAYLARLAVASAWRCFDTHARNARRSSMQLFRCKLRLI